MKHLRVALLLSLAVSVARADSSRSAQMTTAAKNFLAALSADQKQKVLLPFDSPQRRVLTIVIPTQRAGILRSELNKTQWDAAWKLVALGLSDVGQEKVKKIMTWQGDMPNYTLAIWGKPDAAAKWGWRLEGHHVSLNFQIESGRVRLLTAMLGANDLPLLAGCEEKSLALWQSLTEAQKTAASGQQDPLATRRGFAPPLGGSDEIGVKVSELTPAQKEKLDALVNEYYVIFPDDLAKAERPQSIDDALLTFRHEVTPGKFILRLSTAKFLMDLETRQHYHTTLIPPQ